MSASETIAGSSPAGPLILNEKNLGRNIFKLAGPAILENLSHSLVFFVDFVMIGGLGSTTALSAVSVSGNLYFVWMILCIPLAIGVTALVAHGIGARNHEQARRVAWQGVLLGLLFGGIVSISVAILVPQILDAMGIVGETRALAIPYERLIFGAFVFDALMFVASAAIRGAGNTRTPMLIIAIVNAINVLLDWLLIFGHGPFPRLGVTGAGIGTAVAMTAGGVLMVLALFTRYSVFTLRLRDITAFSWSVIRKILRIAMPSFLENCFIILGYVTCLRVITSLGDAAIAANGIAVRIESLSFLPGLGFGVAASTLSGQSLGAGNARLAEKSMKRTAVFGAFLMSIVGLMLALFPGFFADLFQAQPSVRSLAVACLLIGALEQVPLAIFFSLGYGLRGSGDTVSAMLVTVLGMIIVRVPCAFALVFWLKWGLVGMWTAGLLDWIARALFVYNRVQHGSWRKRAAPAIEALPVVAELEGRAIDDV